MEGVEMGPRLLLDRVGLDESRAENLHPEQCKDAQEEEEQKQQRSNRLEAVCQRFDQVRQGSPIST